MCERSPSTQHVWWSVEIIEQVFFLLLLLFMTCTRHLMPIVKVTAAAVHLRKSIEILSRPAAAYWRTNVDKPNSVAFHLFIERERLLLVYVDHWGFRGIRNEGGIPLRTTTQEQQQQKTNLETRNGAWEMKWFWWKLITRFLFRRYASTIVIRCKILCRLTASALHNIIAMQRSLAWQTKKRSSPGDI